MTTTDRAREMAERWHCRNCQGMEQQYTKVTHTAMATAEIAAILDVLVEARAELSLALHGTLIEKIDKVVGK